MLKTKRHFFWGGEYWGATISTLLHDRINPKDCQVLSLGDSGFLQFFRVVSSDYGKPCYWGLIIPCSDRESWMFG